MKKPIARILGADGNVFNLVGICAKSLKKSGMQKEATEMKNKVFASKSYDEALQIMMEYVEVE